MKKFFLALLPIVVLISCKDEPKALSEDFWAIAHDSRGHEISLNDSMFFIVPKIQCIVFLYHDSVFKVEIDRETNKEHYSLLKSGNKAAKDTLLSTFDSYRKTTLKEQLQEFRENGLGYGCFSDGYFLFNTSNKLQFGLFDFMDYYDWMKHSRSKEIPLTPKQFPKIYQNIYHTFNSKWRDYYLSNEYHYNNIRVRHCDKSFQNE